jgi:ribosomal protein L11 methyltransferase
MIQVGEQFNILNESESNTYPDRLPIFLSRGRAFGSGDHETTRSCLEQLEKIHLTEQSKVLDVGSGSGILAIAAARMGAKEVIAFDPDPHAISTARANIALNNLQSSILLFRGELSALNEKKYSLIMANLYGDIILELITDLCAMSSAGGTLLLSGILFEYTFDIKQKTLANKCEFVKAFFLEDYVTMLFKKT